MLRWVLILGMVLNLAGCVEERTTRVVPVTPTTSAPGDDVAARPVTKPPRAIATH